MIKRLQRKFILVTMVSVIAVLSVIMIAINVINYSKIRSDVDNLLKVLSDNDGRFGNIGEHGDEPLEELGDNSNNEKPFIKEPGGKKDFMMPHGNHMTAETPYETRFFSVFLDWDENVMRIDTRNIAAVDDDQAQSYAIKALTKKTTGYIEEYRYRVTATDTGILVIFIDCHNRLQTARAFLRASLIISLIGVVAVFVLVYILSQWITRPIAESYEKQKRFITDSSHEIKTPLAVISANTEVVEMLYGEGEWTDSIKNQVDKLSNLTKNLTQLARMDEAGVKLQREMFNLSDAVADVAESFVVLAKSKNKDMSLDVEEGISYNGEEKSIRQLISILLDNAVKYSDGEIKLTLKKAKGKIEIDVYNTATDIDAGNLDHYFDRFYRADKSRSKEIEGFGIGLSIAKSIVELHGGRISAKSVDGKSVEMVVVL